LTVPFNDLDAVEAVFREHGPRIACLIIEPVAGNMGCVPPQVGYLEGLRRITKQHGALLIFDEVITGFRLSRGGAQGLFGVLPDLTALGKVIGGGLPIAAYGGRADIMSCVAPAGPVYQAGTLSGNPLAVSAGIAMLHMIEQQPDIYSQMEAASAAITSAVPEDVRVNRAGSVFTIFFQSHPVHNYADAKQSDTARFGQFFHFLLERGIYWPPSQFEAVFMSAAHTADDIGYTAGVIRDYFAQNAA
jgi:glutamate-1-semialdehyde 2,1-aminomutase